MNTTKNPAPANSIRVEDHLGLAHLACRHYAHAVGRGFDYDDLFQAACEGLLYAATTYDPERGAFSTHAVPLARRYVKRLVTTTSRTVRVPEYAQDRAAAAGRVSRPAPAAPRERRTSGGAFDWSAPGASVADGGPVLVASTLAPYAGVPSTWTAPGDPNIHAAAAERSLDFAFGDDTESTLHDVLADDTAPTPEALAAEHEIRRWWSHPVLAATLATMTEREQTILVGRLCGQTQPQLAEELGLTKARIQQIESAAAARLLSAINSAGGLTGVGAQASGPPGSAHTGAPAPVGS